MAGANGGATYADAIIAAIEFAKDHPWRFLLTMPISIGLGLVIMVLVLRILVIGPINSYRNQYDTKREQTRRLRQPRLPL